MLTLLPAGSASAVFHLVKVSEVYPGTALNPDAAFIELQMFAPGQNLVAGHEVVVYNSAGNPAATVTMDGNLANGQNNSTVLLGDSNVGNRDFDANVGTLIAPAGGAVCFPDGQPPDCVAWGSFSNPAAIPGAVGTPVAPAGIPDGSSIQRSIEPGCPTLLEASDDTDDSATDFFVAAATPRGNSEPVTEAPCARPPDTRITKGPKKKTKKRTARFGFRSIPAGAAFQCRLDRGAWGSCSSPQAYRKLKRGKHVFHVRASAGGRTDPTPARHSWKVKKKR